MMNNFTALVVITALSISAFAGADNAKIAENLYPNNQDDQAFVVKFLDILELQKSNDPFFGGNGPSVSGFSLDKLRFAFMANETEQTVDLIFFNWGLKIFASLIKDNNLSNWYGSDVFILKNIDKKTIATQGKNHDELTNFSHIEGAQRLEKIFKLDNPDFVLPEQYLNLKPHPDFMDRSHPLRDALAANSIALLSPSQQIWFKGLGFNRMPPSDVVERIFSANGGYYRSLMGNMIHEMFHLKESSDIANGLSQKRKIPLDRKALTDQLNQDIRLKQLLMTYLRIVFSVSNQLKNPSNSELEKVQLSDLNHIIQVMKKNYSNAWNYVWDYEYIEGFAEYTSASSMIQGGVVVLTDEIDHQINSRAANFCYRTGTLGGLYLANRLKEMPFSSNEDKKESVWEIIIRRSNTIVGTSTTNEIISKYQTVVIDEIYEIKRVSDYLRETILKSP